MTRSDRVMSVLKLGIKSSLDDVLPRRLQTHFSENQWTELNTEITERFLTIMKDSHELDAILTEGDIRTGRNKINMAGIIAAIEKEVSEGMPVSERTKITHLVSYLKKASENIGILRKR